MSARVLQALRRDWAWSGIAFEEVIATSRMGHLLLSDAQGVIHYLDPDLRQLLRLGSEEQTRQFLADPEVALVWRAEKLVAAARERLGEPGEDEVYTLNAQAMLAGDYAEENLVIMPLAELISFTGQIAYQTRDLPEGATFELKVVD